MSDSFHSLLSLRLLAVFVTSDLTVAPPCIKNHLVELPVDLQITGAVDASWMTTSGRGGYPIAYRQGNLMHGGNLDPLSFRVQMCISLQINLISYPLITRTSFFLRTHGHCPQAKLYNQLSARKF